MAAPVFWGQLLPSLSGEQWVAMIATLCRRAVGCGPRFFVTFGPWAALCGKTRQAAGRVFAGTPRPATSCGLGPQTRQETDDT